MALTLSGFFWSFPRLSFDPILRLGIQCSKFCKMSNHNHQHVSLQQEETFNKGRQIFFVFSPFSVCRCSDARITVSHPASLRRRRTGWNRAPASSSWRRSRSWRRRWTGTWTGSAKQVPYIPSFHCLVALPYLTGYCTRQCFAILS